MTNYLFFDIDNTLISRDRGRIPSAEEAIHRTREKGNMSFLCTGRHLGSISHCDEIERDGVIFCNGAGISYRGELLCTNPIPDTIWKPAIDYAQSHQGMYSLQTLHDTYKNERELQRMRNSLPDDPRFETWEEMKASFSAHPLEEYDGRDVLKIDIGFPEEQMMKDFLAQMSPALYFVSGISTDASIGAKSGEITLKGVTKAEGIRTLMKYINGNMNCTYAFGDSGNDMEMIRDCHIGIAMGNARPFVKEAADFVTDTPEEDGILHAMEHFNLL